MKYKHLTLDDRIEIQRALKERKSFVKIGEMLGRDASTISKEIKSHARIKDTGTKSRPYNPCRNRGTCTHEGDVCSECIQSIIWGRSHYCAICKECNAHCSDFVEEKCKLLRKPPYVCNGCKQIRSCTLLKKMYDAKEAQKEYEQVRSESRQGISIDADELSRIDDIISPLIKQGQSLHHICNSNADAIMLDERTIYNYLDADLLSAGNLDLPRKVRYRKRKAKKTVRVDKQCHKGRTYEDYLAYMDSVEGKQDSKKVLLTLLFTNCNFMLAFLRDANTARSVTEVFNRLDEILGREKFCSLFPVIITDRGSEFTDPMSIEFDEKGERRTRIFYCDPQRSNQKGSIEVGHEFIRRVLPKKTSFEFLTQEKVDLMMNHINSYKRKKLSDREPLQMFSFLYGSDTAEKLNARLIPADEICLKPDLLK